MSSPTRSGRSLLRDRRSDTGKVDMVELFFDLVFVFAVTQLSHTLLADLSGSNALRVGLMLVAVWWAWIYTSWVTNWLDPTRVAVRASLFALMFSGLVLSASIPQAFGTRGWAFALAYVFMQVGRTLFVLWAVRQERHSMVRNFQRILAWLLLSGVFWLIGASVDADQRLVWWVLAIAIETAGPWLFFRVPGLGRSRIEDWDVDGGHMAERCALFIIIALGESLIVSGTTFTGLAWSIDSLAAIGIAFAGAVAMWWLYFAIGAETAHHRIAGAADPGRLARIAYTYLHVLIVAGVIVCAVADELVLSHPAHADPAGVLAIVGGPVIYLAGTASFKWATATRAAPPLSHLIGLALLAGLAIPAVNHSLSALGLLAACTAVLWVVASWEFVAWRRP